jgi:hypothetical protein
MEEYNNDFEKNILKNSIFINKLKKALEEIKNKKFFVKEVNGYKGYVLEDEEEKSFYLILDNEEKTIVYRDDKSKYTKPLEDFFNNQLADLKYSAKKILSINKKNSENNLLLEEKISLLNQSDLSKQTIQMLINLSQYKGESFFRDTFTSNPYELRNFLKILEKNELSFEFNKDFLLDNPDLYKRIEERVPEFGIILESILVGLNKNSINEKNKFTYNDLDNSVWKNGPYILSTEQNFSWIIDFKDRKNFIVYASLSVHNGNGSKAKSLSSLLKKIKSEENIDNIDYVGLRVENGKVKYANNNFITNLDFNIMINASNLEEEKIIKLDYGDIDIKSFEYQFAYANKKYGSNKISFLIQSLFVLGNGYFYNQEEGKIYTDVEFIPDLLKNFQYQESNEDQEKINSLMFLAPPKLEYLDDQWLENLKFIINKIKEDKPNLSKTHTRDQKTAEEVLKELENVIDWNENFRKNKMKP